MPRSPIKDVDPGSMMDSNVAIFLGLVYGSVVLFHNHRFVRQMWTNLFRMIISFGSWLKMKDQQFRQMCTNLWREIISFGPWLMTRARQFQEMCTNLWREIISFGPWLTTRVRQFVSVTWSDKRMKLVVYGLWWFLGNVAYEKYNKEAHIALGRKRGGGWNPSFLLFAVQLLVGPVLIFFLQWIDARWHSSQANWINQVQKLPMEKCKENLSPVGLWISLTLVFPAISARILGNSNYYSQFISAAEPLFAGGTAYLLGNIEHHLGLYHRLKSMVWYIIAFCIISLISDVLMNVSLSSTAFGVALLANQATAVKNVVCKGTMDKPWAKAFGSLNTYAVVTFLAFLFTVPLVLALDANDAPAVYDQVMRRDSGDGVIKYSLLSGLSFHVSNYASFLALQQLSPVNHAVLNVGISCASVNVVLLITWYWNHINMTGKYYIWF